MDIYQRLDWVRRNRARTDRVQTIGAPVRQILSGVEASGFAASRESVDLLSEIVDDEFRRHCRVAVMGRRLLVNVDQESLVYPMRMRWHVPLNEVFGRQRRRSGIRDIIFDYGKRGIRLARREGEPAAEGAGLAR